MSKILSQLGGEMGYCVPSSIEAEFLREVPTNPPSDNIDSPK